MKKFPQKNEVWSLDPPHSSKMERGYSLAILLFNSSNGHSSILQFFSGTSLDWIHIAGALPSTLHKKIQFIFDDQLICIYAMLIEEDLLVTKPLYAP